MGLVGKIKIIFNFLRKRITAIKVRLSPILLQWFSRLKFPHFPRKLTAALPSCQAKKVISLFLLLILLFNLGESFIFPFNEEKNLRYQLLNYPQDFKLHERLGRYYLEVNNEAAEREYLLAEEFYRLASPSETGMKESPWQKWSDIILQRQKLEQEILFWEEVRQAFPSYHYATFKLAAVHFQLGNDDKAREYIKIAREKSPTDEAILRFAERLK